MNADWLIKLTEMYKRVEEFENAYLSPKAVFNCMHTVGMIDEEEAVQLNARYDHTMEPVRKKAREAKKIVYEHAKALVMPLFGKKEEARDDDQAKGIR